MEQHSKQLSEPAAHDENGMKCTVENVDKGPVTNPVIATSHANPDMEMSLRDNPDQQAEPGSDESAPVSIAGQLADAAEEVINLREELERLHADLSNPTQDCDFAQTEANALRTMRKQTKDLLESMKETIERLQEERDDARNRCDEFNERAEKWQKRFKDLEEETSDKRSCSDRYPSPVPPTACPQVATHPEHEDEHFYSMYDGDTRWQEPTGEEPRLPPELGNTSAVSTTGQNAEPVGTMTPFNITAVSLTASHSYAQVAKPTDTTSKGPQVPQPAVPATRPVAMPNKTPAATQSGLRAPEQKKGLESSRWSDDVAGGLKQEASEMTPRNPAPRGRHTPRGGVGFGFRGRGAAPFCGPPVHHAPPELEMVDGRGWVNTTHQESADLWRQLDACKVHERVSGSNRTRVKVGLQDTQRLLIIGTRGITPQTIRTAAQCEVVDFALWAESMGNHPRMRREHVAVAVCHGTSRTLSSQDTATQLFLQELRPVGNAHDTELIGRVNTIFRKIFLRPGTYSRLVELVDPNGQVNDNIYADSLDVTFLLREHLILGTHSPISTMSTRLKLPYIIAQRMLSNLIEHGTVREGNEPIVLSDDALNWAREGGLERGRHEFVTRVPREFAVQELSRMVWANTNVRRWRWMLPPPPPSPTPRTAVQALQEDISYNKVKTSLDWLPDEVWAIIEPALQEAIVAWESSDVLDSTADVDMDAEAGAGPA